ncbi:MAG: hypothetical protein J6W37_04355 [Bacteroidales bacterium]|nr:hypothetical protein [Bacteroidales bacterium]
MLDENKNIEQLFSDRFRDAEETPSNDIWEKLESNLDKHNVEGIFQTAFQNAAVEPAASVWQKIAKTLAWKSFLTFRFNTFNVYYASVITAILGISAFQFLKTDSQATVQNNIVETTDISKTAETASVAEENIVATTETAESVSSTTQSSDVASSATKVDNTTKYNVSENSAVANPDDFAFDKDPNKKKRGTDEDARNIDWSHVRLIGNASICKDVASTYAIEGLTVHADIQWKLPKAAKKNSEVGHNVSIIWTEAGQQTITALVKVGDTKKTYTYNVMVEGVAIPEIKGKVKVCQGMEKQLYYVDEKVNNDISYLWESQHNTIDQIGNKYINVDWTKSGKDTLFVTKINTVTGCKSQTSVGIVIYPQPKINFEVHPLGDQEYEFAFTETQRKGYVYEWMIEGTEYNDAVVTHEASGAGSSFVTLKVTDKNGCSSTIQKEVDFNKNFISVPSKYNPSNGKYFVPLTNSDLQSYKLEIYNARNEKVWESTELNNGKPAAGWDGKVRGVVQPRGKYMWKISATFDDGTQWKGVTQPNGSCKPSGIFILEN